MKLTLTKNKRIGKVKTTNSSAIKTKLITEPQDKLDFATLIEHLFHIEAKDVTLKWVFDHLKNYLVCGALFWIGLKGIKVSTDLLGIPYLNVIAGICLMLSATILMALNLMQGLVSLSKIRNLKTVGKTAYVIYSVLLIISAFMILVTAKST